MSEPDALPETEPGQSKKKQIIAGVITVVTLLIVFGGILPQLADYGEAWDAVQEMSGWSLALLILATVGNIVVYTWPYQAALPGIGYGPAFVVRNTSFAISNGVPAGGAFGLAVQYKMLGDYGFGSGPATAAIVITSVWNTLVTLGLPVLGAIALIIVGDVQEWAVSAAAVGLIAVVAAVGLLVLVFRSESAARRIGEFLDRLVTRLAKVVRKDVELGLTAKILSFRTSTIEVVNKRAWAITLTNILQQLMQFAVLFIALRGIQHDASVQTTLVEAFVAFSVGRLGSFIPLTPGGLGTVDALMTGFLVGFGAAEGDALAATLVWRASTFFPQMFMGIGTFIYSSRRARKELEDSTPPSVS